MKELVLRVSSSKTFDVQGNWEAEAGEEVNFVERSAFEALQREVEELKGKARHLQYDNERIKLMNNDLIDAHADLQRKLDKAVEGLRKIVALDKDPYNHHKDAAKCAICFGRKTLASIEAKGGEDGKG